MSMIASASTGATLAPVSAPRKAFSVGCSRRVSVHAEPEPAAGLGRRAFIFVGTSLSLWRPSDASANIFQDYVERTQRPEVSPDQAVVQLLDARGVLYELRDLAKTDKNSDERFRARSLLPGIAKRLREAGQSAPAVIARVTGGNVKSTLSSEYGGKGGEEAIAVPVYQAIGQVITISGRTIRKEAQASPEFAENAIEKINALLDMLPKEDLERAHEIRKARRAGAAKKA